MFPMFYYLAKLLNTGYQLSLRDHVTYMSSDTCERCSKMVVDDFVLVGCVDDHVILQALLGFHNDRKTAQTRFGCLYTSNTSHRIDATPGIGTVVKSSDGEFVHAYML
ncbi:hypothetical protein V6N13_134692 [Hibiscus sabdariffa]|uniref:Reverse transcriptase Ty1/copia-type domain-containing protein n=1 Tax=Hibiscus sabdariffa TaxID=183260 RepID=A0ABR1Z7H4_9ROSI